MNDHNKMKLMSQLFPAILALVFLCISFWFGKDNSLHDVFLGASLGIFSIAIVNVISIAITYKNEIVIQENFKKEIAEKVRNIVLSNIRFVQESFDESIKSTLVNREFDKIEILAHTGKQFLNILDEIDFKCSELSILLQDTSVNKVELLKEWQEFFRKKNGAISQITIYLTSKDSDKLLYGMIIERHHGIMGFYTPNTVKVLNVFGYNSDILGHPELLNVIQKWFDYYLHNAEVLGIIPDEDKNNIRV